MPLPPRYRVRVKTTDGIEEYPASTQREADEKFSEVCRWDTPKENLAVMVEDSGRDRSEWELVKQCDLKK